MNEDAVDNFGNDEETSFIMDQIRNIKQGGKSGRNLQIFKLSPLSSNLNGILGAANIQGCVQQSGNTCNACNKQSLLENNKCRCDFRYDLNSEMVSA